MHSTPRLGLLGHACAHGECAQRERDRTERLTVAARIAQIQASKAARIGAISPEETGGFKYTPDNAILKGTVNDATSFPEVGNRAHGSYHWAFERIVAASLIPLAVSAAVVSPTAHVSAGRSSVGFPRLQTFCLCSAAVLQTPRLVHVFAEDADSTAHR